MLFRRFAIAIATLGLVTFAFPVSASGIYCFCDMTGDRFGQCAGHQIHKTNVSDGDDAACATTCNNATLSGGKTYADYNGADTPVDWVFQGSCLGPNPQQTSPAAKAAQASWKAPGGGATVAAGTALSKQGSVVSLNLPLSGTSPQIIIGRIIKTLLGIIGSLALVMFLYGGFRWMISRGNAEQVQKAKQTIVWATLGLIVIFAAYAIVSTLIKGISGQ